MQNRRPTSLTLLVLSTLLAACQSTPPAAVGTTPEKPAVVSVKKSPPPPPTQTASQTPTVVAPTVAPVSKLLQPKSGTRTLSGIVTVDAVYAVQLGGTLIADAGGVLVANNGGALVGNNGGAAIAVGGSLLDATGRLVANNGGAAIAVTGGGNVAAPGSGGVASQLAGGILLANNGGSLVGKTKRRLTQTAPPTTGEIPAAGMLVSVISLRDHTYLPLGEDSAGKPVYAVYSNATGGYTVHVPTEAAGNLLVVACPPGAPDERLSLNAVAAKSAATDAPVPVDEGAALTTRYMREGFTGRVAEVMLDPGNIEVMLTFEQTMSAGGKATMTQGLRVVGEASVRAGLTGGTVNEALLRKAQRIVDLGLADVDLQTVMIDSDAVNQWTREPTPAFSTLRRLIDTLINGAGDRLAENPAYFATFLTDVVNAPGVAGELVTPLSRPYEVKKPSDFGEFLLKEFLSQLRDGNDLALYRSYRMAYGSRAPLNADPDAAREAKALLSEFETRTSLASLMVALSKRFNADPTMPARLDAALKD